MSTVHFWGSPPQLTLLKGSLPRIRLHRIVAIELFKLNVREYPRSAEVYADLAEAYRKKGDIPSAIENYRKALEKDPQDVKIQKALAQLEKRD